MAREQDPIKAAADALHRQRYDEVPGDLTALEYDATVAIRAWLRAIGLTAEVADCFGRDTDAADRLVEAIREVEAR